ARPARPRPAHRPPAAQPGPGPTPGRRRRASLGAAAGQGQRPRTDLDPDRGARVEIGQWTRASAGRAHWRVHAIAAGLSLGPWRPGPAQRERRTRHQERTMRHSYTLAAAVLLVACGGGDTGPAVDTPGRDRQPDTRLLEAGAGLLQDKPIDAVNSYLDGFHFYSGDMDGQMEAHHYCSLLNEDVIQRVIYDGNVAEARLMGAEYIIGEPLFRQLPPAEKDLWHSHVYEVRSGQLVAPGLPGAAERALMEKLVGTYGKTWHTWHTDIDKDLPYGVPQLMMGFTA